MRIQKYCSERGICSRREAEEYIQKGYIRVNGRVVHKLGTHINPETDTVKLSLPPQHAKNQKKTICCYKPRGYTCSKARNEGPSVFSLFPQWSGLNSVGRLDKESEGLLLLSNDGRITKAVTGNEHKIEKEYEVEIRERVTQEKLNILRNGIQIDNVFTLPAVTKKINDHKFQIILKEGKKHQIRRMADAVQWTITRLKRTRIGPITLRGLEPGKGRSITENELRVIINS